MFDWNSITYLSKNCKDFLAIFTHFPKNCPPAKACPQATQIAKHTNLLFGAFHYSDANGKHFYVITPNMTWTHCQIRYR